MISSKDSKEGQPYLKWLIVSPSTVSSSVSLETTDGDKLLGTQLESLD